MLKYLFLIILIVSCPAFASCPVDTGACVAEFQSSNIQDIIPPASVLSSPAKPKEFSGIKDNTPVENEIEPTKSLRNFGSNSNNYGYNSSCQFGQCPETGTPKNFPLNANQ